MLVLTTFAIETGTRKVSQLRDRVRPANGSCISVRDLHMLSCSMGCPHRWPRSRHVVCICSGSVLYIGIIPSDYPHIIGSAGSVIGRIVQSSSMGGLCCARSIPATCKRQSVNTLQYDMSQTIFSVAPTGLAHRPCFNEETTVGFHRLV